jgi:hypothetical protein
MVMKKKSMGKMGDKGKSSPMHVAVGSGSRPNGGRIKIPSSAPADNHTLERAPKGWLK